MEVDDYHNTNRTFILVIFSTAKHSRVAALTRESKARAIFRVEDLIIEDLINQGLDHPRRADRRVQQRANKLHASRVPAARHGADDHHLARAHAGLVRERYFHVHEEES